MSYVRSQGAKPIAPETVQALAQMVGLELAPEDLLSLAEALSSQMGSMSSLEQLDLTHVSPALHMDPRWRE